MWILAIDIGGTAIKCGLVNSQGERRQLTQFPMNKEYATVTQRICRHIDHSMLQHLMVLLLAQRDWLIHEAKKSG